jgi:hypothetical protein
MPNPRCDEALRTLRIVLQTSRGHRNANSLRLWLGPERSDIGPAAAQPGGGHVGGQR